MPQGWELHVLVAQNFSATKESRTTNTTTTTTTTTTSITAYDGAGQRGLRRAETGSSVEIGVFGV